MQWKVRLQSAQQELDRDRSIIETPSNEAIKKLQDEFRTDLFPDGNFGIKRAKLRTTHKEYATVLNDSASQEYRAELVPKVYGWIADRSAPPMPPWGTSESMAMPAH